jgi:hypothetical protein
VGFDLGKWIGDAAKTVGKPIGGVAQLATQIDSSLGRPVGNAVQLAGQAGTFASQALASVPVVGRPLEAIYDINLMPFKLAVDIANGRNVGQAALQRLRDDVADVRTAAPLIQSVIAVVPGVGPVASGAISAGLAVAEGQPIDAVMEAAIAGAIPGGALAVSSFKLGQAVLSGKVVDASSLAVNVLSSAAGAAGVNIPPQATSLISAGLATTAAIAKGQAPDQALLQRALPALGPLAGEQLQNLIAQGHLEDAANKLMSAIPASLKGLPQDKIDAIVKGLGIGAAIGYAQKLQSLMGDAILSKMAEFAIPRAVLSADEQSLMMKLPEDERGGFVIGCNVRHAKCTQFQIAAIRALLKNSKAQDGFDAAMALHIGEVIGVPPASIARSPELRAGFAIHQGLTHAPPTHQVNVLAILPPPHRLGAALSHEHLQRAQPSLWPTIGGMVAGGVVGLQVGGPVGAFAGALLGFFAGKKLS